MRIYIGTYTSEKGSKGIYTAEFDSVKGDITGLRLAAEGDSPSFLALNSTGTRLYAANENLAEVSSYEVLDDGPLKLLNSIPANGEAPCHLVVGPKNDVVLVACYGDGFSGFRLDRDGKLVPNDRHFKIPGTGPNKNRQEKPHGHSIQFDPHLDFIYACDLGTDHVIPLRLAGTELVKCGEVGVCPPGSGPRHLAFYPFGRFIAVLTEMTSSVCMFEQNPADGSLRLLQTLDSILETGAVRASAEIQFHPRGEWLLASNRGHDSVSVVAVSGEGTMRLHGVYKVGVKTPRGMSLDPTSEWLVVGGQDSNDLKVFRFDAVAGTLTETGRVECPQPVSVHFA
ncbi:lactonase family protein [soil metagenome]